MKAEVGIAFGGIRQTFTTRNTHVPGREVRMKLVDGPFSNLDGRWKFTPVGDGGAARLQGRAGPALRLQERRRWRRWSGRCSTRSPAAWSTPSSSAPSRSTAEADAMRVTVVYSPAPRAGARVGAGAAGRRHRARGGAGQRPGRSACPRLDLAALALGVWGRRGRLEQLLRDGDRVEVYRPLQVDPKVARRERFRKQGARAAGLFARNAAGRQAGLLSGLARELLAVAGDDRLRGA